MNLYEFQQAALESGRDYVVEFEDFPSLALALRVGEEAGEVQGAVKKTMREARAIGASGVKFDHIKEEIGDALHALSQLASYCGMDLHEIAVEALKKQRKKGDGLSI